MTQRPLFLACLTALPLLNGYAVGPDYVRPSMQVPAAFCESEGWKIAEPQDDRLPTAWWELYGDPILSDLVKQVEISNQNVLAAAAQYRQAEALTAQTRASWFPNLGSSVSATRSQGVNSTTSGTTVTTGGPIRNTAKLALASSWELDVWGRISRSVESNAASAAASAADLAAARLSAQAALVQDYLALRINDAQQRLLNATVTAYQRSYDITRNRYESGVAAQADVAQAESQLKSTQAQAVDLRIQRAQLEHAIALLLGKAPAEFRLAATESIPRLPQVPAGLPSALLERRPDVAGAERRVAAANAQIGVTQAAFFPTLTLSASGGYQNSSFSDLLSTPNRFWSVGPALALTLFDAGARSAVKEQAVAGYDKSVATYRQTVLTAFQEVEDNLVALRVLDEEKDIQAAATKAAEDFLRLTNNQYQAGTVSFLNVATAQATALGAQRASLDVLNRQLAASVGLIKALGGGDWRQPLSQSVASK